MVDENLSIHEWLIFMVNVGIRYKSTLYRILCDGSYDLMGYNLAQFGNSCDQLIMGIFPNGCFQKSWYAQNG